MPTHPSPEPGAYAACVADIRELCVEFQRAIAALASDDLPALEAGIEKQEDLANQLQDWFHHQPSGRPAAVAINHAEFTELINLTKIYSLLLTRSIRTIRLRTALCRTYQQEFAEVPAQPEAAPNLSCEA